MVEIIPSIFEKSLEVIEQKITQVSSSAWVQIVFADNTLIQNESYLDISGFADVIKKYAHISFEAHLLVAAPEKYLQPLIDAGFKRIIIQVESNDPRLFLVEAAHEDVEVGLALDGPTEVEQLEPFLEEVDMVLIMTIEAGFAGQPFLPETIEKIRSIRQSFPHLDIAASGSITTGNAQTILEAGAQRLVIEQIDTLNDFIHL